MFTGIDNFVLLAIPFSCWRPINEQAGITSGRSSSPGPRRSYSREAHVNIVASTFLLYRLRGRYRSSDRSSSQPWWNKVMMKTLVLQTAASSIIGPIIPPASSWCCKQTAGVSITGMPSQASYPAS